MKTDQLIEILGKQVEPVRPARLGVPLIVAVILGAVIALCLTLAALGLRSDIGDAWMIVALKLLFAGSVIGVGSAALMRAMRPGQASGPLQRLIVVPFLALCVVALGALALGHADQWDRMLLGPHWATRLVCIPLFATLPFLVLVWAVRQGAPTDLRRAGALIGLVAGALGAAAYAFFCPDDSLLSIAVWYAAAIALCALGGALLGPRLLRW